MLLYAGETLVGRVIWFDSKRAVARVEVGSHRWTIGSQSLKRGEEVDVVFNDEGGIERLQARKRPHKCRTWHLTSYLSNGSEVHLRCPRCLARKERKTTKKEQRALTGGKSFFDMAPPHIHTVWWDFRKRFLNKDDSFKYKGYDLMCRVARWAKKHPNDVQIVGCDDSHYSSSDLVLIEHKTVDKYHGTTVVFIAQCSGDDPIKFFLYPGHRANLIGALVAIRKAARPVQAREGNNQRKRSKHLHQLFRDG